LRTNPKNVLLPQAVFKELADNKEVVHHEGKDGEIEYGKSHRKASNI
jgi:hypothetical protein